MSSLFSCFGKKSKVKRGNKEPKDRSKNAKRKEQVPVTIEDERKPPLEESIPDKAQLNGDVHKEEKEEAEVPPPEEPKSPLIQELEIKLQDRKDKNKENGDTKTEIKETKVNSPQEKDKEAEKKIEQTPQITIVAVTDKVEKKAPIVETKVPAVEKGGEVADKAADEEIEKLKSEIAQLRTENNKLKENVSENEKLKNNISKEKSQLEEKIKSLEDSYKQLQAKEKETNTEYEELKRSVSKEGDKFKDEVEERLGLALKERQKILESFEEISKLCCNLAPRIDNIESIKVTSKEEDITPRVDSLDISQKLVSKDVTTLRHHIDELELRIIRLEVDKDNLEDLRNEESIALDKTKKENTILLSKIKKLEVELEGKKTNLVRVEKEKAQMSTQLSSLMTEVESLKRKMDELSVAHGEKEAELENSLRKHSTLNEEIKVQGIKIQTMTSLIKEKEEACNKADKKLREAKKLNEELMKRLHEQESKKHNGTSPMKMNGASSLHHQAPIADDIDRLRIISERFSVELYGGLWREAYEKLTTVFKREEKKSLQILMDFCTEAYLHCRRTARQQLDSVYSLLTNPSVAHGRNSISRRSPSSKQSTPENIPPSLRQQIVQFRKDPSRDFLDSLYDDFLSVLDFQKSRHLRSFHMKEVKDIAPYITKCLAISWEMVVQDPPMYLQFKVRHGTPVDREKYNFYTIEGDVVDYLVWPAVLREENGAVLQKGMVQAISSRPG
ncbi:uncharacterized protein LOC133197431 isoform X2 [Saccostrea echinata]|uniref:uncharacterized protein LOC133197431 isoform X2 n=1 Tax=Saccostrea echinata TaxID=191078 RepID=UPI002A83EDD7|nr:uncharacterized protein LOC133197431 isoform X2 [Saccostrea echinata]